MSVSKLFGDNERNLYPASRILANNVDVQEFEITAECENNPALVLAILYNGVPPAEYADVFFAVNHITDPYTQLTKGRLVKRVSVETMSSLQQSPASVTNIRQSTKVRHAKVSNMKVTF